MNCNGQEDGSVQRCEKSSESLESNVSYVCCKAKKVPKKCSDTKDGKSYCCKMKCKTADVNPSDRCEQPETINKIRSKLFCIIEKLNHLIDTYPTESKLPNDGSAATGQQPGTTDTNNPPGEVMTDPPEPSCDKLPAENDGGKPSHEKTAAVTPANTAETPVPPETKVEPKTPESKTAHTAPKEQHTTDAAIVINADDKSSCEVQPSDSCADEVENKNQKLDSCITDHSNNNNNNNDNDDGTNKNIGADGGAVNAKHGVPVKTIKNINAEAAVKPKSPVSVKTIRNQTKPNSGNKQLPAKCVDQNKIKRNSRNIQSSSSDKKSISKR